MLQRFRHIFAVVFFLLVASCSGGGCSSGCSSCGGMTPLPGGFPKDKTIDNAASVRVSRPGLDFVEKNLPAVVTKIINAPGGNLGFDIPTVDPPKTEVANIGIGKILVDPVVCEGGADPKATPPKCHANVGIGSSTFQIDSITPNAVKVRATIPLELEDTPVSVDIRADPIIGGEFGIGSLTLHIGYGNGGCNNGKPNVTPKALPVGVTIPIVEETTAPRNGYAKLDLQNAVIDLSGLTSDDVKVCSSCGFATDVCSAVTNSGFVKGLVVDPLKDGLAGQVKSLLADQLCTAPVPTLNPPCPTGSAPDAANKYCVYNSDKNKCVSMLLGTDSHVDLGGLLKSISPGTTGGLDFGLAAGGAMQPFPKLAANAQGRTPNGITLGMVGGVVAQPPSKCVTQAALVPPTGIPFPDELAPAAADPATTPHVGIALAGRFLDYAMGSVYNSGLLCLGVSSEQIDMLRAGLVSLLVPSLKNLTFQQGDAAVAIATRPQAPPTIVVGDNPLLTINLPKFALDFYIWHLDRYSRVFTFESDLAIPVNLQTGKDPVKNPNGGIIPAIGDIKVANGKVTNADLLLDEPALVAGALQGLLGGLSKQLVGGGFSPIDLSGALTSVGLGMEITSIKKLSKGTDNFVGIFANLSKAAGTATVEADTTAKLLSKTVDVEKMQLATMDRAYRPELALDLGSSLENGKQVIEYAWWIDQGTRSEWSTEKHLVVNDDQLFLQGKHILRVASRIQDAPETEDTTPAEVPFTIDAVAPFVNVEKDGAFAKIEAWDIVSSKESLVARYRVDGQAFGEWRPVSELARIDVGASASALDVEVKDEEGNVRSVKQDLIRGRGDSSLESAASGCSCSTPGKAAGGNTDKTGLAAIVLGALGLGIFASRRRRAQNGDDTRPTASRYSSPSALAAVNRTLLAVGSIGLVAATSQGCGCGSEADDVPQACGSDCLQECKAPLALGRPGSYTSIAKASDGAIWVAGYNEALIFDGDNILWGDLVVGRYDLGQNRVDWKTVDGLPAPRTDGTCADRAITSWRNGEEDGGDDVGLYTSIQVSPQGKPMVSYYDLTHKALKFAIEDNGWKTITLFAPPNADAGRYSKMALDGGKPVIAFLVTETGGGGKVRSKIVVARANVETPREPSDFKFEDAAIEENNPCNANSCGAGACLKNGECAPKVGGCTPADCGSGKACVTQDAKATCVATMNPLETYSNVFGARLSLAVNNGNLGIAAYDRPHGNLVALVSRGGKYDRYIVDGETGSRADKTALDTGDVGIGIASSLAIDNAGTWHMSYVSGLDETLRYVTFTGDKPGRPEVVDDGTTADGKTFPDGKAIIGDDSAIKVEGDIVTIVYQDATHGTLRRAVGTKSGATHKWDVRTLAQPGKVAGYFPAFVPGEDKVANFWETADRATKNFVGDVSIVSP